MPWVNLHVVSKEISLKDLEMAKTRLGLTALGFACVAFLFILLAFVTSSWLVTDGELEKPKFESIGMCYYHGHLFMSKLGNFQSSSSIISLF